MSAAYELNSKRVLDEDVGTLKAVNAQRCCHLLPLPPFLQALLRVVDEQIVLLRCKLALELEGVLEHCAVGALFTEDISESRPMQYRNEVQHPSEIDEENTGV